jgi:PAS domain S-box-containing protein
MSTEATRRGEITDELERTKARVVELERELERRKLAVEDLRRSEEKYRTLVESSPYCIKLIDENGRLLSMNRSGLEMINEKSEADIIGRHYLQVVCARDLERVTDLLDKALAGEASEFDFFASVGRFFRSNFVPIIDEGGRVTRLLSITQDVTDRRRLVEELNHRVKNNLAAMLALSKQTRRSAQSLDQFVETFDERIRALARSHEALSSTRWHGVQLHDVLRIAIEGYVPLDHGRVDISGDDVRLPSRACGPLTLALHEMTTNAVKYGAFASPEGSVAITTAIDDGQMLELRWVERAGERGEEPLVPGVGTNLIRGFVEHELNGSLDLHLGATGLVGLIRIPLGELGGDDERLGPGACEANGR